MLRQVRHISEGNFYGLRVTNKAQKLNLAKEIRTIEACRDVQTHVYRKEEKELLDTLKRLQISKHDHFHHHEDYDHPERFASHQYRDPSFHAKQHSSDDQRLPGIPAERHHRNIHEKTNSEIGGDHRSSTKVPCQVNTNTNASDVSVIISLLPKADSNTATKKMSQSNLPPVSKREAGKDLHRTDAFMHCVVCNLPPYAHGRQSNCTCNHARAHSHELKHGSKKRRKSNTGEESLQRFAVKREGRQSWEDDHVPARHAHQIHHARNRASSFENDSKDSHASRGLDEYTAYVPGVGPHKRNFTNMLASTGHRHDHSHDHSHDHRQDHRHDHSHDHGKHRRENSLGESKSRKSCLDEGSSLWNSYEAHSGESRFGDKAEPHYMRPLRSHGLRHNKTRQVEELYDLYHRLQRIFPVHDRRQSHSNEGDRYQRYSHHPGDIPHSTHLPFSKSHRDVTPDEEAEDSVPAFSGLLHPDNIINHHHFLPHEANKQERSLSNSFHAPAQPASFHVSGVDRHGHRQGVS